MLIELLSYMFMLLKDYNASVANKEGLQLATEGANVSFTNRIFVVALSMCSFMWPSEKRSYSHVRCVGCRFFGKGCQVLRWKALSAALTSGLDLRKAMSPTW